MIARIILTDNIITKLTILGTMHSINSLQFDSTIFNANQLCAINSQVLPITTAAVLPVC